VLIQLKKLLPQSDKYFKQNEPLKHHTYLKIGGKARYFYLANEKEKIIKAVQAARKLNLPFVLLGEGSNVLVADKGFSGLVIKALGGRLKIDSKKREIIAEAGVPLREILKEAAQRNLGGLEFLFDIPGTLGAAIRGNVGAFGGKIQEVLVWVEILDEKGKKVKLTPEQCHFAYRESRFKHNDKEIILEACLKVKPKDKLEIYQKMAEIFKKRREAFSAILPSCGSVFKNLYLKDLSTQIKNNFNIAELKRGNQFPVKYLIEDLDLKGKRIGQVQISWEHPNVIVNLGQGRTEEVIILIGLIKQKVRTHFNIQLQEEIEFIGF
jgi:UDP-N-acetylmuramate dehydrogenase